MMRKPDYMDGGQLPMFVPNSNWVRPATLPDLRNVKEIGIDSETRDDGLRAKRGPGWVYHNGRVVGFSVAWGETAQYFPIEHPDTDNFDRDAVRRWLNDHRHLRWVFQNAPYDLGWFWASFDLEPPEQIDDITGMAVMLDQNQLEYNLDAIAKRCGVPGKDMSLLKEAASVYGFSARADIYRLPAKYCGEYAASDALATLRAARVMRPLLAQEGTGGAYQLEMDLIPLIQKMRIKGIAVNVDHAEQTKTELLQRRDNIFTELAQKLGERVGMEEIGRTKWLERVFDAEGIKYPRTASTSRFPEGQPSFTAGSTGWMHKHEHWLPRLIVNADRYNNAASKFVQGFIIDYAHHGRLHASIDQFLFEEDGGGKRGTRTFRFAYSFPALQQMPKRDAELKQLVRGCFVPDPGCLWGRVDYEQQEFRLIVHFANLMGFNKSRQAAQRYIDDPTTDFHNLVADLTGLDRKSAKDVNFAKAYGAGIPKFAGMTNMSLADAERVMNQYDEEMPFVKQLGAECTKLAGKRGYIKLIDGARIHFPFWEGPWMEKEERNAALATGKPMHPCRLPEAEARCADPAHPWHGKRIRRADVRKAMNALIQGSAARQTKMAMRDCYRAGIIPQLQVHDELNNSFASQKEGEQMAQSMRDTLPLTIPMGADVEWGYNWARAEKDKKSNYGATWDEAWIELKSNK
jgi:DNA polymerase I-like protein with 3'-5' exonuclease and polymerase domains